MSIQLGFCALLSLHSTRLYSASRVTLKREQDMRELELPFHLKDTERDTDIVRMHGTPIRGTQHTQSVSLLDTPKRESSHEEPHGDARHRSLRHASQRAELNRGVPTPEPAAARRSDAHKVARGNVRFDARIISPVPCRKRGTVETVHNARYGAGRNNRGARRGRQALQHHVHAPGEHLRCVRPRVFPPPRLPPPPLTAALRVPSHLPRGTAPCARRPL